MWLMQGCFLPLAGLNTPTSKRLMKNGEVTVRLTPKCCRGEILKIALKSFETSLRESRKKNRKALMLVIFAKD